MTDEDILKDADPLPVEEVGRLAAQSYSSWVVRIKGRFGRLDNSYCEAIELDYDEYGPHFHWANDTIYVYELEDWDCFEFLAPISLADCVRKRRDLGVRLKSLDFP